MADGKAGKCPETGEAFVVELNTIDDTQRLIKQAGPIGLAMRYWAIHRRFYRAQRRGIS